MDAAELDRLTAASMERLETTTPHRLKCGHCGHEDAVPDDPKASVYTCDQCGARVAYGAQLPKVAVLPHPDDKRFLLVRFDSGPEKGDVSVALDREYFAKVALEILSVTDVEAWRRAITKP